MKTKIVFDLDGVIRDLSIIDKRFNIPQYLRQTWWTKYKGMSFYDWVAIDLNIIYQAKPTKFYKVIKKYADKHGIEFWTHQLITWREYTTKWINKYFGCKKVKIRFLDRKEKWEELQKYKNVLLVEDSPFFKEYDRIILIDQSYNKKCEANIRIKTPKELEKILNRRI